jgi:hypothetical protein
MLVAWIVAIVLVLTAVFLHYEVFRLLDWLTRHLTQIHRMRVAVVVLGCFCAHLAAVTMFAGGLYGTAMYLHLGTLEGNVGEGFKDFFYFSIVTYTSLGIGDVYPTGHLRLLTGVEALLGLVMITWSATFTFLEMQKIWNDGSRAGEHTRG